MPSDTFTLQPGGWVAMTMYPGYGDLPYHSPCRIEELEPLGKNYFRLSFLNLAYASGVQDFIITFGTLKSARHFLACAPVDQVDRMYVFTRLTPAWMKRCFPHIVIDRMFDEAGEPVERALLGLI